jgi:hypothetical protein
VLIKGVTGGKEKGNPIEYSPAEKFPLAVKKFLGDQAPEGKMYMFSKVEFDDTSFTARGISEKGWANNAYTAKGKVWYKVLDIEKDKLFPEKEHEFSLHFEDSADEFGLPDIKLVDLKLQ